jgi:hypothetical protein
LAGGGISEDPIDADFSQLTPDQAQALLAAILGDAAAMSTLNDAIVKLIGISFNPANQVLTLTFNDATTLTAELSAIASGVSADGRNALSVGTDGRPYLEQDRFATPAAVEQRIQQVVGAAPATLDTLAELAGRLQNDGNAVVAITNALTTETANRLAGDQASGTAIAAHANRSDNPHGTTKAQVGLGRVDNTADTAKPVSTLQAAADAAVLATAVQRSNHEGEQPIASVTGLLNALAGKADRATTLAGYGIADAYTMTETDNIVVAADSINGGFY